MTAPTATAAIPVGQQIRRARGPLLIGTAVLVVAAVLGLGALVGGAGSGYLEPDGVDPGGSRALARLLADAGVAIVTVRTADAAAAEIGPRTTLLVTDPALLNERMVDLLTSPGSAGGRAGRTVLVGAEDPVLSRFSPEAVVTGTADLDPAPPTCTLPEAVRAGSATIGGATYVLQEGPGGRDASGCYPAPDLGDQLVVSGTGTGQVALLGGGTPLTNQSLAEQGNAALAMGLLGSQPTLVWYLPAADDPLLAGPGTATLQDLIPPWVPVLVVSLLGSAMILALARARRLGPVVTEPLPVIVRAGEATLGRGRLYRRTRARDVASRHLRAAALRRAGDRLGSPVGTGPDPGDPATAAIIALIALRTGRSEPVVRELLAGPAPVDDAGLVQLARALDTLEEEIARS